MSRLLTADGVESGALPFSPPCLGNQYEGGRQAYAGGARGREGGGGREGCSDQSCAGTNMLIRISAAGRIVLCDRRLCMSRGVIGNTQGVFAPACPPIAVTPVRYFSGASRYLFRVHPYQTDVIASRARSHLPLTAELGFLAFDSLVVQRV